MKNRQVIALIKKSLSDFIKSHEPIDNLRIVPEVLQEEFEATLATTLDQASVSNCKIQRGLYIISIEHTGLQFGREIPILNVIQRISLSIRRFYQKYGIVITGQEVHIRYARNGLVIMIALNDYGREQIATLNREQLRQLRRRAGR